MRMRVLIQGFLVMLVVAGLAQANIQLSLAPVSQTIGLGGTANVEIVISGLGDEILSAFDLDVIFDPAMLSFDGFVFGDPVWGDQLDVLGLGSVWGAPVELSAGQWNLFELSLDTDAALSSLQLNEFVLGTLSFSGLAIGTSAVSLSINSLGSFTNETGTVELNATVTGATVTTIETVVPAPGAVALCAVGLGVVGWLKRRGLPVFG